VRDDGPLTGWGQRSGLAQVRWVFLLFAFGLALVSLPGIWTAPGTNWWWRAAHVVAVGWLLLRWRTEYRRGPSQVGWHVLDAAALLVVSLPESAFPAVGLFYGACYWRAVSLSTVRAVGVISAYGALFAVVVLVVESVPPPLAAGPVVGLLASSLLIHLIVATMGRHELSLSTERELLAAVLENLDVGVLATDADGALTVVNDAAHHLHPVPIEPTASNEVAGRYGLFEPDGVTPVRADDLPLTRALRGERVRNREVVMASDAGRRTVFANGRAIVGADGRRLGAVLALHDVTGIKRAEAALQRQATHDSLTDLPNRELLRRWLEHAFVQRQGSHPSALLFVDLDGFKTVNDSLGHATGDTVLQAVARRLLDAVSDRGAVARLGGDEFAVLVEDTDLAGLRQLAEHVLARLSVPLDLGNRHLVVTASVGVATSDGAPSAGDLLRNADLAMYAAKEAGRSRFTFFAPSMHEAVVRRLTLEAGLRQAISQQQLQLAYQPIFDLRTGQVTGVEALARWSDPSLGVIAPSEFIPLAEASGLVVPLGSWVLSQACRQAKTWRTRFPSQPIVVAVNLSVRQVREPHLVEAVAGTLSETSLDPTALVLEITEGTLMDRLDAFRTVQRLRDLGVSIAIDDFGTGYSSLARLRDLPVDLVKIDKSFIDAIDDQGGAPIAAATIALAHSLGLRVVAEGVETEEQVAFLRGQDCDAAQGFLLHRPGNAAVIDQLLALDVHPLPAPRTGRGGSPEPAPHP